jgi:hypothetical protein
MIYTMIIIFTIDGCDCQRCFAIVALNMVMNSHGKAYACGSKWQGALRLLFFPGWKLNHGDGFGKL